MRLALVLSCALAAIAGAQVKPNADWRTITTEHFYIHFTPELEPLARRAAVQAETAYDSLSRHLTRPRGKIDIVISDDVDYSNGWATPYPSNRIGIYANPPVFESALRFTDDPTELVVTHELTHLFHLDRVGGIWKVLQMPFGRVPYFFPNAYQPRWLVEGLAVYYESKITGSGRIVGSEHHMIARTAAIAHRTPRIDQLSLANPHFPYGYSAYAYGSLFIDHLARTYGDRSLRTFVESSSRQLIPWWLNFPARRAFGRRLTTEWKTFADSLLRTSGTAPAESPMPGWLDLTVDGAYASFPRWFSDSTLVYSGTSGKETYGAFMLQLGSPTTSDELRVTRDRLGRRNSRSPNTILPDGSLLYSQLEYTSAYNLRSDLYLSQPGRGTRRLTRGARLAFPDARADGRIVAVQTIPAGTRIALVSPDGRSITPITSGGIAEQWSEPRWSPDGNHIAAIRWTLGGTSEVAVIDTTGRVVQTLIRERTINATPSWSRDGRFVYFSSDRTGVANLYRASFHADTTQANGGRTRVERVSNALTGLFEPELSPNGSLLAASVFKADGYHVGIAPLADARVESAATIETVAPRDPLPPSTFDLPPSRKYSPRRSLLPRAWLPYFESALDSSSVRYGAFVSGTDVVGRHSYQALLFVPDDASGVTGAFFYRNASLGQPLIDVYFTQDWENRGCILLAELQNQCGGFLRRRIQDATAALTVQRPKARSFSFASVGFGFERRKYVTDPEPLLDRIDSTFRKTYYYPQLTLSAGWNNVQYPPLAISPEDGISISGTARIRDRLSDTAKSSLSLVGATAGYKSVNLPGYGHHVLGLHVAGGLQDSRGTGYFEVGGVSGGTVGVVPGYVLGEGRRTFSVRGFPAASLLGMRAYQASAEYRAPLILPGRGLGTLPLFLDRTSITLFGDAGSAWCPGVFSLRPAPSTSLCTQADVDDGFVFLEPNTIGSVGAELNVTAAILSWDAPFRYRLGYAVPVIGREFVPGAQSPSFYFTVGASF